MIKTWRPFGVRSPRLALLDMGVVADMVFTVAIVAVTAGAVPEFQLRVGYIGSSANGTAVIVWGFGSSDRGGVGTGGREGNGFAGSVALFLPEQPGEVGLPADGEDVHYILAEEEEIVQNRHQGEQTVREVTFRSEGNHIIGGQDQIHNRKYPGFHRNDEQQQELGIGIQGSVTQKQTQVQVVDVGIAAENHAEGIHQNNAGKVVQVKTQGAPQIFHGLAERIVAYQHNQGEEQSAAHGGQRVGNKPPNLALEDSCPVEAEDTVQDWVAGKNGHQVYHGTADAQVKHQVGNAFVAVAVAEPFKTIA